MSTGATFYRREPLAAADSDSGDGGGFGLGLGLGLGLGFGFDPGAEGCRGGAG
jgi:hypothetical protein